MDLETQIAVMGDAVRRHAKTDLQWGFAASADVMRTVNGWTYRELREAAAVLVRILDDYLIVEEAEQLAGGGPQGPHCTQ
jgi:hypothetical protein